jgi:hypothetical protein
MPCEKKESKRTCDKKQFENMEYLHLTKKNQIFTKFRAREKGQICKLKKEVKILGDKSGLPNLL